MPSFQIAFADIAVQSARILIGELAEEPMQFHPSHRNTRVLLGSPHRAPGQSLTLWLLLSYGNTLSLPAL